MTDRSRRKFNKVLSGTMLLLPMSALLSSRTAAAAPVDPESAAAKALKFTENSDKEGQICSGCLFYTASNDATGKCIVLANGEVPSAGWCTSFQAKK